MDDALFLSSFEQWSRESPNPGTVVAAVRPLWSVKDVSLRTTGLTPAVRVSSAEALEIVAATFEELKGDPRFQMIVSAISLYPKDISLIAPLRHLRAVSSGVPGMDAAMAAALKKLHSKQVLPDMAALLDSSDREAQLAAASFFGLYTLFATADGEFPDSGPIGPFATAATRENTPRPGTANSVPSTAFWKTWWSENRDRLGFRAP